MPTNTTEQGKVWAGLFSKITNSFTGNSSSRRGAPVRASVLHTTESADGSLAAIVSYFKRAGVDASSSYVVGDGDPDKDGFTEVVRVVPEDLKPWTQLSFNPFAVSYEMIGRAKRTRAEWLGKYRAQVRTVAALCAEDSIQYGLPVQHAVPGQVGHVDLSKYGFPQSHTDPGTGFPWDVFLDDVKHYKSLGKGIGVPPTKVVVAPLSPAAKTRPKGVPLRIPAWAWDHREWDLTGRQGPRPQTVETFLESNYRIPVWYWAWRPWYDKTGGLHH